MVLLQALYYIKLFMFADQLGLNDALRSQLRRVVQFVVLMYAPAWLACPVAADAPALDLALHQKLLSYKTVDSDVAGAALQVAARHVWYLRPQLVPLALCSRRVANEEKETMARALLGFERPEDYADENVVVVESTTLSDLVDERSWLIFDEIGVCEPTWLNLPPAEWGQSGEFIKFEEFVTGLSVTNDVAERGIKMIQDFVNTSAKAETQLQALMQVVETHRRQFPDCKKATLEKL